MGKLLLMIMLIPISFVIGVVLVSPSDAENEVLEQYEKDKQACLMLQVRTKTCKMKSINFTVENL